MTHSHYRWSTHGEFCFNFPELPPRSPHFDQVVHTTGGRPLIGHGVLTVSKSDDSSKNVGHSEGTSVNLNSPSTKCTIP